MQRICIQRSEKWQLDNRRWEDRYNKKSKRWMFRIGDSDLETGNKGTKASHQALARTAIVTASLKSRHPLGEARQRFAGHARLKITHEGA